MTSVILALGEFGPLAIAAIPQIESWLESPNEYLRVLEVTTVSKVDPSRTDPLSGIRDATTSDHPVVRSSVLAFLARRRHRQVNLLVGRSVTFARPDVVRETRMSPARSPQGTGGVPCSPTNSKNRRPFETMSKRRRGFPSETQVKRGVRIVHGDKLLEEKLGRNDLCPCGSGKRFKTCCLSQGCF